MPDTNITYLDAIVELVTKQCQNRLLITPGSLKMSE